MRYAVCSYGAKRRSPRSSRIGPLTPAAGGQSSGRDHSRWPFGEAARPPVRQRCCTNRLQTHAKTFQQRVGFDQTLAKHGSKLLVLPAALAGCLYLPTAARPYMSFPRLAGPTAPPQTKVGVRTPPSQLCPFPPPVSTSNISDTPLGVHVVVRNAYVLTQRRIRTADIDRTSIVCRPNEKGILPHACRL